MNKAGLVESIVEKTKHSKKVTEEQVKAMIETIEETLAKGEKVTLVGFGTFETRERAARMGRNPRVIGAEVPIPACTVPTFKAGQEFKDLIKQ